MVVPLHRTVGAAAEEAGPVQDPGVALAAVAVPGPALATPDRDLAAALTPGHDLALVQTARAHEADPGPGLRVLRGQNAPANHVLSPKIKIERAYGFGGVSAVWCFI